jgi:hypothetical protein
VLRTADAAVNHLAVAAARPAFVRRTLEIAATWPSKWNKAMRSAKSGSTIRARFSGLRARGSLQRGNGQHPDDDRRSGMQPYKRRAQQQQAVKLFVCDLDDVTRVLQPPGPAAERPLRTHPFGSQAVLTLHGFARRGSSHRVIAVEGEVGAATG